MRLTKGTIDFDFGFAGNGQNLLGRLGVVFGRSRRFVLGIYLEPQSM